MSEGDAEGDESFASSRLASGLRSPHGHRSKLPLDQVEGAETPIEVGARGGPGWRRDLRSVTCDL